MLQNFADDIRLIYEADYFHLTATLGTGQRINLPYLPDALPPLGRGDLLRRKGSLYLFALHNVGRLVYGILLDFENIRQEWGYHFRR